MKALVWPVATYGCESWTLRKNEETRLEAFEMKGLRKILCVSWTANSTQLNEHRWMQVLKHLNVHIYLVTIAYRYYNQLISRTDLSPILVRSATKSYLTSCILFLHV